MPWRHDPHLDGLVALIAVRARRLRVNPNRSRSLENDHVAPAAHRQGSVADQINLLEVLMSVSGSALKVRVRRDAHQRGGQLTPAQCLRQRAKLSRDIGALVKIVYRVRINMPISIGAMTLFGPGRS